MVRLTLPEQLIAKQGQIWTVTTEKEIELLSSHFGRRSLFHFRPRFGISAELFVNFFVFTFSIFFIRRYK